MNKEYIMAQLRSLPNAFQYAAVTNYINSIEQENTNLKQALNEIREYVNQNCNFNGTALYDKWIPGKKVLQIIDKVREKNN